MKLRVYIVDDDPYYARLLSYRLDQQEDHEVQHFTSGEDLLARLAEVPDLLLLDLKMPGMDGLEVLQRVKGMHPSLPILIVSAQGVVGQAGDAIKLGAFDYVTKGQDDLLRLGVIVKNIKERKAMEVELSRLREENRELQAQVDRLRSGVSGKSE
ncbi:MAG TPA: response regulator [Rhodothermales bacterium]|nr:response regulator [Rhodothermales bacterium]